MRRMQVDNVEKIDAYFSEKWRERNLREQEDGTHVRFRKLLSYVLVDKELVPMDRGLELVDGEPNF